MTKSDDDVVAALEAEDCVSTSDVPPALARSISKTSSSLPSPVVVDVVVVVNFVTCIDGIGFFRDETVDEE